MAPLITAKPKKYPHELLESELKAHQKAIQEYQTELSESMFKYSSSTLPDVSLINQQPELRATLRGPLLDFLFKVAKRTKVTQGIFYKAVRLMDRYCSKRIVLRDQAQLVAGTCLWLSAKVSGGCNHIINSSSVPSGGRFAGPTVRSRIPRLTELVQLCGPTCGYDEGMFIQMERHILETLSWDVCDSSIYNWVFDIEDYQVLNDYDEKLIADFKKIQAIKNFLVETSVYSMDLISVHPSELALIIKKILITLILNDESYFNIKVENLTKILKKNSIEDNTGDIEYNFRLINHFKDFSMNLANRLLLSVANVTQTVLNSFTTTEDKEINEIVLKVHKVAISHIMALHEENKNKQAAAAAAVSVMSNGAGAGCSTVTGDASSNCAAVNSVHTNPNGVHSGVNGTAVAAAAAAAAAASVPSPAASPSACSPKSPSGINYTPGVHIMSQVSNVSPRSNPHYTDYASVQQHQPQQPHQNGTSPSSDSDYSDSDSLMSTDRPSSSVSSMSSFSSPMTSPKYHDKNSTSRNGSFVIPSNNKFVPYQSNNSSNAINGTSRCYTTSRKGASFSGRSSTKQVPTALQRVASQLTNYDCI